MAVEPSATLANTMSRNLWLHFAQHGTEITPPIIARGEGVTIYDDRGKSYLDALSGLFAVQVGTAVPNSPRSPPGRPARWRSSRCGATPPRRRSSSPSAWLAMPRAT